MTTTRLLLIRHGETEDNHRRVFQGQGGRGLHDRGRDQVARLAARLARGARIDAIYTSDLERAQETADLLANALGLGPPVADAGLREVHVGAWQGLHMDEIAARFPEEWAAWRNGVDMRRGGGETYAELGDRVTAAIERIAAAHPGQTVAVVSHGASIKTLVARVLGIDITRMRRFRVAANTGVCLVERDAAGDLHVIVWNDTSHLDDPLLAALSVPL